MRKIRRIFETTQEINFFSPQKEFALYWESFLGSELGGIYQAIPWRELIGGFKIKENKKISITIIAESVRKSIRRPTKESGVCYICSKN